MPTHKNLKKMIRARMSKTGESYSTARMHVLANASKIAADATTANADPPNAAANVDLSVAPETSRLKETTDAANPSPPLLATTDMANPSPSRQETVDGANPSRPLQQATDANPFRPPSKTMDTNRSRLLHDWRLQQISAKANSAWRVQQMTAMSDSDLRLEEMMSTAKSAQRIQEIMGAANAGKKPGR